MGILDTIKDNFTQGGVVVQLATQTTIARDTPHSVLVRVSATDNKAQQILSVKVILEQEDRVIDNSRTSYGNDTEVRRSVIASVENTEPFNLNPGEVRDIQLTLSLYDNSGRGFFGKLGATMSQIGKTFGTNNYSYSLVATANVKNVALDPSSRVSVQLIDIAIPPTTPANLN